MDDGLIQFLVIAVVIIVSMMDGASRKRRREAQSSQSLATYDDVPEAGDDPHQVAESSEGMVPEDLWGEIAALARGEVPGGEVGSMEGPAMPDPASTRDADFERGRLFSSSYDQVEAPAPTTTPAADLQGGYLHPDQALTHEEHAQVVSSAQPPAVERPHEFVPHPARQSSKAHEEPRPAEKARSLLSGVSLSSNKSLRDAIIVAEVLSPPVTLRDSGWKPLF